MKRWSTTAPISTKPITTSHLKSLNNKRSQHMLVEIQVMAWEWHTSVAVLNWLMVYLHSLNNWISNDNTDINKQLKKNEKIFFHSKEISHFHKNE
jgi:hypothetical protein